MVNNNHYDYFVYDYFVCSSFLAIFIFIISLQCLIV